MSKPPKLDLASIVAAATPSAKASAARASAARKVAGAGAEIVRLGLPPSPQARPNATLKQRARQMSVYLEPPVYDQLREMAHAERTKMHALMLEALDLLFRQRGARSIAQVTDAESR